MVDKEVTALAESIQQAAAEGRSSVLFDLTSVPAVDSAALELMLDTQDACRRRGGVARLTGVQPLVAEVLAITELDRNFESFPNQLDALGSFST